MGTITNATPLSNLQTVHFDNTEDDNYYSFTLNSAGNVLFSDSGNVNTIYGNSIDSIKIYNSSFTHIYTIPYLSGSTSTSLSAGTYYIQAVDTIGGSFSVSSTAMSGTPISATPLSNGTTISFDSSSADNYYSFTLNSAGNVLFSGLGLGGDIVPQNSIDSIKIYDSSFTRINTIQYLNGSTSTSLSAGTYYIQAVDTIGGSFSVSSTAMSGTPISATPLSNGTTISFDSSSADNYYSFTLNSAGNVLFSGLDALGADIASLKIYNSTFALIDTVSYLRGSISKSLSAGSYYVHADDSNGGSFSVSSTAMSGTINLNTIPTITSGETGSVAENAPVSSIIYDANATDEDAGTTLRYHLSSTPWSFTDISIFNINSSTGEVTFKSPANYETQSIYYFNVIASDGSLFDTKAVVVNVTNVNETPTITSNSTGSVAENAPVSTIIYDANATDEDAYTILSYSLSGTDSSLLNINSSTGEVTLKSSANYETKSIYSFNVIASDVSLTDTKAIIVNVTNVNETPTITSNSTGSVAENAPVSTIIYDANATDEDAYTILSYSLSGTDSSLLNINSSTGEVTLKSSANYETKSIYSFNVIASDVSLTDTKAIIVNVTNVNETPTITSNSTGSVAENAPVSTIIYDANATDEDAYTILSYSLSGTDSSLLNINSSTGEVTLKSSANYETKSIYSFNVIASDVSLTDTKAIIVNVTNVNETQTSDISTFVERLYTNVLGRPSDASGLANWVNVLQTSNASDVAESFFNSQEFLNANYSDTAYVQKLYSTFFDRTYDEGGLTHWLSQLNSGTSRSAVLDGFAQSSEFATIAQSYGIDAYESGGGTTTPSNPNLSPVQSFVERFYTEVLGRASDASGLANWSAGLENGSKTADDIAQGFFFSQEFINRNLSNSDFIDVTYETLLNRQADSGGKSNWLTELNGGMSRSTMLDGFIYSAEFDTLAGSYGIEVGTPPQPAPPVDDTVTIEDIAGRYNLLYADAEIDGVDIHLDASDVRGSYLNISSNGSVTQYVKYMGQSQTSTGTITEITDTTITIYAYGEENEYSYSWNDPYLTTSVDVYESGVSYSETDHWILV